MDKLKYRTEIGCGIRARKYEKKIRCMNERRWIKICWLEKQKNGGTCMEEKERSTTIEIAGVLW